jgi:hypothetical protein
MGELVVEKLTQKVSNMLDEIGDVNILIRRLTPTQETLNRINERVDAVFAALKQLEKGVQLDEKRLAQLEELIALLQGGLESVNKMAGDLVHSFDGMARELKVSVQGLEVKVGQLGGLVKELGEKSDDIRKRLGTHDHEEYGRWEDNNKVMGDLQKRLIDLRVKGIILIVLVLMVLSVVLFRRC